MKNIVSVFILFLIVFYSSCSQSSKKGFADKSVTENIQSSVAEFDINSVPITNSEIGEYPYLSAPKGYQYTNDHNREYEEKYFFYNDSLIMTIGGQYYHTMVLPINGQEFSETNVVKNYEETILQLGGVLVYSGKIINIATDLLRENSMQYAKDMYDPYPYNYKQFLIRTPKGNVWFELCYGLNTEGIDFTVVYEEKDK
ncbi:MAG: hypothetical protein LBT43_13820 [Prevotella sp.]|jgi:hypothetical protein|nr:hypothetical protein [Prevotella sp.]